MPHPTVALASLLFALDRADAFNPSGPVRLSCSNLIRVDSQPVMEYKKKVMPTYDPGFVRTGDMVKVLRGDDKGTVAKVIQVMRKKDQCVVEGVNIRTTHKKPQKEGEMGKIVKKESPIYIGNVKPLPKEDAAPDAARAPAPETALAE
mmetsp:Transcript_105099/g.172750  ORF Transcript_105099/g.172750 Transcript_105099/m.172750 type:complete len:148 (+) Transcript_105099:75-518(+)